MPGRRRAAGQGSRSSAQCPSCGTLRHGGCGSSPRCRPAISADMSATISRTAGDRPARRWRFPPPGRSPTLPRRRWWPRFRACSPWRRCWQVRRPDRAHRPWLQSRRALRPRSQTRPPTDGGGTQSLPRQASGPAAGQGLGAMVRGAERAVHHALGHSRASQPRPPPRQRRGAYPRGVASLAGALRPSVAGFLPARINHINKAGQRRFARGGLR